MRAAIARVYPKMQLKLQVMKESQIKAIYFSLRDRGKFKKKPKEKGPKYEQLALFNLNDI